VAAGLRKTKRIEKMLAFGHICPAWPQADARKNQSKNVGLRPHLSGEKMLAFGHICPAWPKADARKQV
jgi:hypothetical protein